ncbi:hypothetical protein ACFDTO_22615 [Microbacteriaceae bacterium 4G12]
MKPKQIFILLGIVIIVSAIITKWSFDARDKKNMETYEVLSPAEFDDYYVKQVQEDPSIRGFKVFNNGEGRKKIVVLTLGDQVHGKMDIQSIKADKHKTKVTVKRTEKKAEEKNSMLIFQINYVPGQIEITDTEGNTYKEFK